MIQKGYSLAKVDLKVLCNFNLRLYALEISTTADLLIKILILLMMQDM
jgi:hypothetical protein